MSILIEEHLPVVKYNGLNTDKAVAFGSTLAVTGAIAGSAGISGTTLTMSGLSKFPNQVNQNTITDIDAQSATPTIAQILGGIVTHNSKTGAGTVTVPIGTAMSAGVSGVAIGSTISWLYYNRGNQTATITADTDHTLVGGTAAVTTGKHMQILSVCTAANTWVSYLETLM
jgi:hypothetical protein